jgi:hypothetical protein
MMPSCEIRKTLAGRKALVAGANSGIGKGVAIALGKAGAEVVVNYVAKPEQGLRKRPAGASFGSSASMPAASRAASRKRRPGCPGRRSRSLRAVRRQRTLRLVKANRSPCRGRDASPPSRHRSSSRAVRSPTPPRRAARSSPRPLGDDRRESAPQILAGISVGFLTDAPTDELVEVFRQGYGQRAR